MWSYPAAPADSFYQVRPEYTDVPKTKFRIKDDDEAENDGDWISCEDTDSDVKDDEEYERKNQSDLLTRPSSAHSLAANLEGTPFWTTKDTCKEDTRT